MKSNFTIITFILLFLASCQEEPETIDTSDKPRKLSIINSYPTNIPEASGLCEINKPGYYYAISDGPTNTIYKIDSLGNIIDNFIIDAKDIEGITIHAPDSTIWLVDEGESQVICLNRNGKHIRSYEVNYGQLTKNKGLEGITYNSFESCFYLVTEKNPALLIKWLPGDGIKNTYELDFADDYSAITYNEKENLLWITSDESARLFLCTLEGDTIKSYDLPMNTIEGLVPTNKPDEFVGISDGDSKLYRFGLME